jgi:hypothetical protein
MKSKKFSNVFFVVLAFFSLVVGLGTGCGGGGGGGGGDTANVPPPVPGTPPDPNIDPGQTPALPTTQP